ncbi:MAG: NAD-dependent epimerase/dehydratase family protein [Anaerolineae bacterium]|nr:NAD-dependent epimerase/dehydratase family protein [Anaerolineae bacterium]
MTSLVTGGAGFVGSHVVRALLAEGERVRVLVRPGSDLRNLAGLDVEMLCGDVCDAQAVAAAVAGCDVVYHLAARYSSRPEDAAETYAVNVGGTKRLLRAALAAGVARVVLTSTVGTIGRPPDGSLPTEETPFNLWATASHYVKSKYLSEVVARRLAEEGLSLVIVHPCAPVGPGDLKPTVSGQRIVDALNGRRPSYLPGGINWVSVRDVARGHVLAARHSRPGERYILGHAQGNLDVDGFLRLLAQVSGRTMPEAEQPSWHARWRRHQERPAGVRPASLTADPGKAIRELGLPQTPLAEAFAAAVTWFEANGYVQPAL